MEQKSSFELFGRGCTECIWTSEDGKSWKSLIECPTCREARLAAASFDFPTYAQKRALEYPAIGDQLDSLMKCIKKLKDDGVAIGPEAEAWIAACEAVKEKYPKPEV